MKRAGMIDVAEVERRQSQITAEVERLGAIQATFRESVPAKENFIEEFEGETVYHCTGGDVTLHWQGLREIDGSLSTAWLDFAIGWEEDALQSWNQVQQWFSEAFTATDRICRLIEEREPFVRFGSGKAKDLDREVWKAGMHDSEARWELAREISARLIEWHDAMYNTWIEVNHVEQLILCGLVPVEIADPCGGGQITVYRPGEGRHENGETWFQREADRLNGEASSWIADTSQLVAEIAAMTLRYSETFKKFRRGSQTAKRGE
jgi:hypothetical protein